MECQRMSHYQPTDHQQLLDALGVTREGGVARVAQREDRRVDVQHRNQLRVPCTPQRATLRLCATQQC